MNDQGNSGDPNSNLQKVLNYKQHPKYPRSISFLNYLENDYNRLNRLDQYFSQGVGPEDEAEVLRKVLKDERMKTFKLRKRVVSMLIKENAFLHSNLNKIFQFTFK